MTTRDSIISYQKKAPFVPFEIYLSDGRSFRVAHPDSLLTSKMGILFHESDEGELTFFDLDQVTSVNVKRPKRKVS